MSNILEVHNVSKQYRLGTVGTGTLSHDLNRWFHKIRGKEDPYLKIGSANDRSAKADSDYVWALQDISFNVKEGEVLGIIGKNGAGKSTLLKILSRVTGPTTGSIKAYGRIASLLEVGTGFHPELTGRENIYLNGAILGMSKAEIRSKFDEIVDFSGCERYIDTPVKRYSSGMYVRLAFAVAAHLEPEILIVDEVLAVGDAEFQKKALGKMKDISTGQGRTVLFVSHNMGAVRNLCDTSILMERGTVKMISQTENVIQEYLTSNRAQKIYSVIKDEEIFLEEARLYNSDEKCANIFDFKSKIRLYMKIVAKTNHNDLHVAVQLQNIYKNRIISAECEFSKEIRQRNNSVEFYYSLPNLPYAPGNYSFNIVIHVPNKEMIELVEDILPFSIVDNGSSLSKYNGFVGDMIAEGEWKLL